MCAPRVYICSTFAYNVHVTERRNLVIIECRKKLCFIYTVPSHYYNWAQYITRAKNHRWIQSVFSVYTNKSWLFVSADFFDTSQACNLSALDFFRGVANFSSIFRPCHLPVKISSSWLEDTMEYIIRSMSFFWNLYTKIILLKLIHDEKQFNSRTLQCQKLFLETWLGMSNFFPSKVQWYM